MIFVFFQEETDVDEILFLIVFANTDPIFSKVWKNFLGKTP